MAFLNRFAPIMGSHLLVLTLFTGSPNSPFGGLGSGLLWRESSQGILSKTEWISSAPAFQGHWLLSGPFRQKLAILCIEQWSTPLALGKTPFLFVEAPTENADRHLHQEESPCLTLAIASSCEGRRLSQSSGRIHCLKNAKRVDDRSAAILCTCAFPARAVKCWREAKGLDDFSAAILCSTPQPEKAIQCWRNAKDVDSNSAAILCSGNTWVSVAFRAQERER